MRSGYPTPLDQGSRRVHQERKISDPTQRAVAEKLKGKGGRTSPQGERRKKEGRGLDKNGTKTLFYSSRIKRERKKGRTEGEISGGNETVAVKSINTSGRGTSRLKKTDLLGVKKAKLKNKKSNGGGGPTR